MTMQRKVSLQTADDLRLNEPQNCSNLNATLKLVMETAQIWQQGFEK